MSRLILDGAGEEFVPNTIAVYVDGRLLWSRRCTAHGDTSLLDGIRGRRIHTFPMVGEYPAKPYQPDEPMMDPARRRR